jgi:hypothetical protein
LYLFTNKQKKAKLNTKPNDEKKANGLKKNAPSIIIMASARDFERVRGRCATTVHEMEYDQKGEKKNLFFRAANCLKYPHTIRMRMGYWLWPRR